MCGPQPFLVTLRKAQLLRFFLITLRCRSLYSVSHDNALSMGNKDLPVRFPWRPSRPALRPVVRSPETCRISDDLRQTVPFAFFFFFFFNCRTAPTLSAWLTPDPSWTDPPGPAFCRVPRARDKSARAQQFWLP